MLLPVLFSLLLSQTTPAIRRSTPASDDPGMVVRQVGTVTVTGSFAPAPSDGGFIGTVGQGPGLTDGGSWWVTCTNCSGGSGGSLSFDGGNIGYMRMPDGGPLEVYTTNPGGSSGGGWAPDGGPIGTVIVSNTLGVDLVDAGVWVKNFPATQASTQSGVWNVQIVDSGVSVTVSNFPATQPVTQSGTWNVQVVDSGVSIIGSVTVGTHAVTQSGVWNVQTVDSGINVTGTVASTQSGVWNVQVVDSGISAAQAGVWNVQVVDSGVSIVGTVASTQSGGWNVQVVDSGVSAAQAGVWNVQVVDSGVSVVGTVTVGTHAVTQSGVWNVQVVDSGIAATQAGVWNMQIVDSGVNVTGTVAATQSGIWNVQVVDSGVSIVGSVTVGTHAVTQSGVWNVQTVDSGINVVQGLNNSDAGTAWNVYVVNQSGSASNVAGTLTHNSGAPAANNIGVLPAVASAAAPTYTAGNQVLLSTDLSGALRVSGSAAGPSTQGPGADGGTEWGVYCVNCVAGSGGTAQQGVGIDAGPAWNVAGWVGVTNFPASQTVAGTVSAAQSGVWNVQIVDSGVSVAVSNFPATQPVTQSGIWNVQVVDSGVSIIGSVAVTGTVAVSGTVASTQSGVWNMQVVDSGINVVNTVTVTGPLTDAQLRASRVPVYVEFDGGLVRDMSDTTVGSALSSTVGTVGFSDGTNAQVPRVYDVDSVGTQWAAGSAIVWPTGAGGQVTSGHTTSNGWFPLDVKPVTKRVATALATAVTCAASATAAPTTALSSRSSIVAKNVSAVTIYIGGSAVTTTTGIPLYPGETFADDVDYSTIYCIVAAGTAELRVMEQ